MDEDLKIVLTSELEADEQASAQRISAQLPNIAKMINSKSTIKVGVSLDSSNIQSEAQKVSRQIAQATKTQGIGVTLNLDQSSVAKIRQELNNLKVSPDISRAMTDQLDKMGIQIDRITGRWQAVNGEEERMLNLTIQGTDQMQRTVTYLQTYNTETGEINTHLTNVTANLERQRNVQEQIAKQAQKDNESRVSYLNRQLSILADVQAAYAGSTSVKPIKDSSHLETLNNTYTALNAQIQNMISAEGRLDNVQRSSLEAQIANLQRLVKEYQNAEYVATKLRTKDIGSIKGDQLSGLEALEKRLEAAGTLTETFKTKIDGLKTSLQNVGTKDELVTFLNSFDQLNNDVSVFQERLRGVNAIYTQLIGLDKQITSVQAQMVKLDPKADQNKLVALQGQLAVLQNQRTTLEGQLVPYVDIVQYAQQAAALEQSRLLNGSQLVYTQMEIADKAREYDAAMQRIPSTIADLQTKYNQLVQPTESVTRNMRQLRELASQYSSNMGDREKVQTYERLQQLIGACSKEMSELMRVQRGEVNDFRFTQSLEKAKADLATVGRTWSALKKDPGLNAQFQQLEANLRRVNSQADLTKWTAQFSAFKSEVKAAGKNMQSLGDVLKNNVGKVLQWVSATTLLFRAFRLLRSAISTIIDLDTAMVDLRKVTVATEAEYRNFYATANDTAKALGVTTEAVISQTAEWARLGYTMAEAAELSKNSAIFAAISPGMDITQATDGLVSALKAFDEIDVNDSLDGIISKVNDIGNKFAVSNKDIVEVMTRSSSAMKAANNTFEETVALATAAVEITRDASSVGNALKTVSMRIRGYDEELEEYSNDVAELTGDIADLTKVASNNNQGVRLFEVGDPDTYRSTYDILQDIATIWDELTDKNRAQLLEVLFGKRQGQIGSAILSNFEQAQKAIETMENSAGSAEREMDKITQSLEYKLNTLQQTWVGVAQNLFQTDDLKLVVDGLIAVSNVIDRLTQSLGLFGSGALITTIALIAKFRSTMGSLQTTVLPAVSAIKASGVAMDGSAASVQFYATKLIGLDKSQQAAAMSALGLTAEQKKQITTMSALIVSAQRYTIQELAEKASTDKATASALAKNMAKATEKRTTEQLSAAMMVEILNSNKLTATQKQAIIASLEQAAANETQAFSWKVVGANAKAALAAMATNPMTWIMPAVTAVMALVQAWQSYKQAQEEARQAAIDAANSAATLSDEIVDLTGRYLELSEAVKTDDSVKEDLLSTQDELIDKLGIEKDRIQELTEEYGNLTDAIKAAAIESLQASERDLRGGLNAQKDELLSTGKGSGPANKSMNHIITTWGADEADINRKGLQALVDAGYISDGSFAPRGMELWLPSEDDFDLSTVEGVINAYERLGKMLDIVSETAGSDNEVYNALFDAYNKCSSAVKSYQDSISSLNNNLAEQYMLQGLIGNEIPSTEDEFNDYRQSVIAAAEESGEFIGSSQDIANAVDSVLKSQSHFAAFYAEDLAGASEETGRYIAQLQKLPEVLSKLKSAYDVLEAAQKEMADGGGLSADTIEKLASAEDNYLDYLYEENGVVKLNTEAWKENANVKMQNEMAEIQKEIDSLEEQNEALRENIAYYEEQRQLGSDGGLWSNLIAKATNEINENTDAIAANQNKLAIYESLYGNITGSLDAYSAALNNFSNVASTIDSVSDSFQTLAELQAEVANGFSLSLDKALEFAKVYPEILNNAQVSADGQVILNEGVVNSFIQGKKAELDAQIDAEVAKLEADKAVLEAKVQAAQAQLDLAQNVGEGEGQIAKELAEYRINAGNIVAQALIDAGIDEATAFKLAAAAMAQNAEEFDRVAMEVCTDVNGNFNQAAYAAAQAVYNNMTQAKLDVASFARQCQEAAKAMAGVAGGQVAGSSGVQGGSGGGVGGSGISLNLTSGSFQGTDYNYTAKQTNLEDFISQIQLDISSYQNAIAQIDGQIAALRALKNIPLKDFKGGLGSGGGGGSGGGSSKEVEEYIADIDAYREAIERLRKAQEVRSNIETRIDESDNLKEKILLERQLIGAYEREQDALHNLNNQRDSTITAGVAALRELGFVVKYNADTNELWIENMERLNDLTADSKGEYDTLQEATNALRKETEDLIGSLTDLNEENRDASANWWELQHSMKDSREEILSLLDAIVEEASKAVDSIQDVYDTLHDAADEYAESGYITVDTLQNIIGLGVKYVAYLMDENGQLVINEERIRDVIAAKTQQLAIESSLSYIEALRIAKMEGNIETLNNLLYATEEATDATWGFVYASLAMAGLDQDQYKAALDNINAIRALADSAVQSIGQTAGGVTDELKKMQSGLDDILKYVMDMLKQRINDQIDALEDMKDAYSEIIDQKKESLDATKDEADYEKKRANKLKEIAKLQARIDALSLDDSREAQAERAKLLEEMAELQEDLADEQADKALDATKNALDDMEDAYHQEKDKEIAILEDSISSYQKLYDMAIDYIQNHWDTLYSELIDWNTQYGSVLNSEITTAWDNALAAAQRYGSYVSALKNIGADMDAAGATGKEPNTVVGNTNYGNQSSNDEMIHAIIKQMYANSQEHHTASDARKKELSDYSLRLGEQLAQYGVYTHRDNGTWYMDGSKELLFDKYKKYIYHTGGFAGVDGSVKDNEIMAKLEKGEPVLTEAMWNTVTEMVNRMSKLSAAFSDMPGYVNAPILPELSKVSAGAVSNVYNNSSQPVEIHIGDTIIQGNASPETVNGHVKVTRDMVNQIARILKIRI